MIIKAIKDKRIQTVPLFIFMSQKEVLHLLPAVVKLVLIVALDSFSLINGIIQGNQELFKTLHDWWGRTKIHVMDVPEPDERREDPFSGSMNRTANLIVLFFSVFPFHKICFHLFL